MQTVNPPAGWFQPEENEHHPDCELDPCRCSILIASDRIEAAERKWERDNGR